MTKTQVLLRNGDAGINRAIDDLRDRVVGDGGTNFSVSAPSVHVIAGTYEMYIAVTCSWEEGDTESD